MTYEYTGINTSAVIAFPAASELANIQGKAVTLTANGIAIAGDGESAVGIAVITNEATVKAGEYADVQIKDCGKWVAGAAVNTGDILAVGTDGKCIKAVAGKYVVARALETASADGDMIAVQLVHMGQLA